jgi:hypothetical protein
MNNRVTIRGRLYDLYLSDTCATKFWSVWVCLLAGLGMSLRSGAPSPDMQLLFDIAPWLVWSVLLWTTSASRLIAILFGKGNLLLRISTPLLGLLIWVFFFTANAIAPNFGLGLLFLIPAIQEAWILSRVFYDERLL